MTDEMLALARDNRRKAGVDNVEFLKGEIEHIPLPDASVDVIISNCVLKPGGRFAVSDVVVRGEVPAALRRNVELWIGCVAGALDEFLAGAGLDGDAIASEVDGKFMSAFVRARKPAEQ